MPGNRGYVIATRPGRTVKRPKNNVQKYARVREDKRFKWVASADEATVFESASDLAYALGLRAQSLEGEPTHDVTFGEVSRAGVSVERIYNGR